MKKSICLVLAVATLLAVVGATITACSGNAFGKAAKNGDNYTIVASYDDEAHVLSAVQTVSMTNRSDNSFAAVKFHLYANQYREGANEVVSSGYRQTAYPNGDSFGQINMDSVKVDGTPVAYTVEGEDADILSVPMGKELFPDQKVTIEMTYEVELANIRHRLGYTDSTVNLGNFYPVLCRVVNGNYDCTPYYAVGDPFVSEVANYAVSLTVPESYVVASSGNLKEAKQNDGFVTYDYEAKAMRDFAMVLSQNFKKLSATVGNTQVNYYYLDDAESETSLATACGMMEMLNKNVGTYPYNQYSVVETEFCYGGMEYPALAMVTSGSNAYLEAVAHETAHQWFYGVVGNDQIANAWMDEGLSEYLTYLYLDSVGQRTLSRSMLACLETYTPYVDVLNHYYDSVDTSFRSVDAYKNDNEYVIFTYVKGSILFHTLYETVGSGKFWKALSKYYDQAQFTVATPSQLIDAFATVGGSELGTIFTCFIEGKEVIGEIKDFK